MTEPSAEHVQPQAERATFEHPRSRGDSVERDDVRPGSGDADPTLDDHPEPLVYHPSPAELRAVTLFADLAEEELAWIAERSERVELAPGEMLFAPGEPAVWMLIALEGVLQGRREHLGANAPVFTFRAGDIAGTIPFSRMTEFAGTGRAVTHAVLARFPKALFHDLLRRIPALEQRFASLLADRVRDATRRDAQFEKLTALGKLSAGLAHELNNPTSAIRRAVSDARRRLDDRGRLVAALVAARVSEAALVRLNELRVTHAEPASSPRRSAGVVDEAVDALARSAREDSLGAWLQAIGVEEPWMSASTFVDAGLDEVALGAAVADIAPAARGLALRWLETELATETMLIAAEQSAARIGALMDAVSAYTHRDRTREMDDVDVRHGLDATLALLEGRVREKSALVVREFADDLPRIRAYPGDLNQAWASLLDNALDAIPVASGEVTVRAAVADGGILVEVRDNGVGIPPELHERVWEPFFTTKDVGEGTGLGLDIARRVVVDLHGGQLTFSSTPGDTRFLVQLPLTTIGTFGA